MKPILLFLFSFAFMANVSANAIDGLKTDNDVLKFILKVDTNLTYKGRPEFTIVPTDTLLKLIKCNDMARKRGVKTWEKVDFNQDGNTDLLVTLKMSDGFYPFAIIDKGDSTFKMLRLSRGFGNDCKIAWSSKIAAKQMLMLYSKAFVQNISNNQWQTELKTDTLIYLYNDFIEYNPKVENFAVKSISVNSYPTAWLGPKFIANILADGKTTFYAKNFSSQNGYFKGVISTDNLAELKSLLNYIQIKKLKDSYQVSWSDDQTAYYEIAFEDGTVKRISDYGTIGTFGLHCLYNFLFDLKESEHWTSIKIPINIPPIKLPANKIN